MRTFGETMISFANALLARTNQSIEMVKRAGARQYKIKTDGKGNVEIRYEAGDTFIIGLFNNSRWVTNVYIDPSNVKIGNIAKAQPGQIAIAHTVQHEMRNVHGTFKIEDRSDTMLKRIDLRAYNTPWFSVFSHQNNMLMVRPNGDWVAEKLLYMTDQVTTQAINNYRRSNGRDILPSTDTIVARRRRRVSITSRSDSTQTDEVGSQANKLLDDRQQYQRQVEALEQDWQLLREKSGLYKEELAEWKAIEERMVQLTCQEAERRARKSQVKHELREIVLAEETLEQRKKRLQEETERYEVEKHEFEDKVEKAKRDKEVQEEENWVAIWSRRKHTVSTLNERFSRKLRSVQQDNKITITNEAPTKLKQTTIFKYLEPKFEQQAPSK